MSEFCPLISNHKEFIECQKNKCELWNNSKHNCSFAVIEKDVHDISYDTHKIKKKK